MFYKYALHNFPSYQTTIAPDGGSYCCLSQKKVVARKLGKLQGLESIFSDLFDSPDFRKMAVLEPPTSLHPCQICHHKEV